MSMEQAEILNALLRDDRVLAENLIESKRSVDVQNESGISALQIAVRNGWYNIVQLLLERGANPNLNNHCHEISISGLNEQSGFGMLEALQALVPSTALHIAAKHGFVEIGMLLIRHGALPNAKDYGGCSPLHWAAIRGKLSFIKLLLQHGAVLHEPDMAGSTPLHEAVRHKRTLVVEHLLKQGADPRRQDCFGTSALDLAMTVPALFELVSRYSVASFRGSRP